MHKIKERYKITVRYFLLLNISMFKTIHYLNINMILTVMKHQT